MDLNVEIARLQQEIIEQLGIASENVLFNFSLEDGLQRLDLITINPRHQQSFLFRYETGKDRLDVLNKMLSYALEHRKTELTYTLQWIKIGDNELQTSYFRAKDIYDLLNKFHFGRNKEAYRIFNIALNPST